MKKQDEIFELIKKEEQRQTSTLMMIPSENYTYPEVRQSVGSVLMHKYAEGQPGKRFYQGNKFTDEIEAMCEERALRAFKLSPENWEANVQPHSGCPANLAVYNSVLEPGDKIMSMYLPDGGHLSHGWEMPGKKITLVSKIFNIDFYHVDEKTKVFNYAKIEKQAVVFKPKMLISGGTAYPSEIDHKRMSVIAKKVGAYYLADISHEAGLVIGGANKSPFPYADFVTFTTHKTLRGPRGAVIICRKEFIEKLDFSVFPGIQGGPHIHSVAGIAIALENSTKPEFKKYALQVVKNAKYLAADLKKGGLDVISGGTQKHLVLIDLRKSGSNGAVVAAALEVAGIIANKNSVPNDIMPPYYPSGLRLGTPAVTTRGMKEPQMKKIAEWILKVVDYVKFYKLPQKPEARSTFMKAFKEKIATDATLLAIANEVKTLCKKFPLK